MKKITVYPDQNKSYLHAHVALEDLGFEYTGEFLGEKNPVNKKTKKYSVYNKDGVNYYFVSMDHFNTSIYKIVLKVLPNPLGYYYEI